MRGAFEFASPPLRIASATATLGRVNDRVASRPGKARRRLVERALGVEVARVLAQHREHELVERVDRARRLERAEPLREPVRDRTDAASAPGGDQPARRGSRLTAGRARRCGTA